MRTQTRSTASLVVILFVATLFGSGSTVLAQTQDWVWQNPLPQGFTIFGLHAIDANAAVAVGQRGTVLKTDDGGATWDFEHEISGEPGSFNALAFAGANTGIAVGPGERIYKTTDGGTS